MRLKLRNRNGEDTEIKTVGSPNKGPQKYRVRIELMKKTLLDVGRQCLSSQYIN